MKVITVKILRILFFCFFFLSAFSKVYPTINDSIRIFEISQLLPLGIGFCTSTIISRVIISIEFFLSIAFITPILFKRITLPFSFILLLLFSIYLSYEIIILKKVDGNCGCFGNMIPMTPRISLVKNILALTLLVYLLKYNENVWDKNKSKRYYFISLAISLIIIFLAAPKYCVLNDKLQQKINHSEKNEISPEIIKIHKVYPNIIQHKQLIGYFSATCTHCMNTARKLAQLQRKKVIPKVYIVFMNVQGDDNLSNIKLFIKKTKINSFHTMMSFIDFPIEAKPPTLYLIRNGKVIYLVKDFGKTEHDNKLIMNYFKK